MTCNLQIEKPAHTFGHLLLTVIRSKSIGASAAIDFQPLLFLQ